MEQEMKVSPEQTVEVVDIQFRPGQKIYYFDPNGLAFQTGDHVIIDTARGAEYGHLRGMQPQNRPEGRGGASAQSSAQGHGSG